MALAASLVGGATMAWFTSGGTAGQAEFTGGTVLVEGSGTVIYGVEFFEGVNAHLPRPLYEIFIENGVVSYAKLFDTGKNDLNALAFDCKNRCFYYADGIGRLYFYDFNNGTGNNYAGEVFAANTSIWNSTFGLGHYWFVREGTDDLYKISFKADGTIDQVSLHRQDFTGNYKRSFQFGDIALDMRDGVIYGSTFSGPQIFFTYNVYTGVYTETSGTAKNMQLAFGADGVLYGTVTRDYNWYTVDPATGNRTWFYKSDKMFGDLASNYQNNWNPGDCDMARYRARNTGTKSQYVRIVLSGAWDGEQDASVVSFKLCSGDPENAHWQRIGNVFYYKGVLAPGETTPPLCVLVCLSGLETGNEYQAAPFLLSAEVEAIQASNNAYQDPVFNWQGYPNSP